MKKPVKALIIIVGIIVALLVVVVVGANLYFRMPVNDYYKASQKGFMIPGLSSGFIPQGIEYDEETDLFFITGYMKDGSSSPIYLVNHSTGKLVATTYIQNEDGTAFTGHAGGITLKGDYVYVAGGADKCIYVMNKADVLQGEQQKIIGSISNAVSDDDYIGSAFLFFNDDCLIVGEFYREVSYPTLDSHKLTTTGGDYNQALAVVYYVDEDAEFGVNPEPALAISLPDLAQGMEIDGDYAYVSMSWGTSKSVISKYSINAADNGKTITVLGKEVPLIEFDSASLVSSKKIAPMSEEIVIVDGKMYVMCESASTKYFFGKLTGGQYCYATDISFWD